MSTSSLLGVRPCCPLEDPSEADPKRASIAPTSASDAAERDQPSSAPRSRDIEQACAASRASPDRQARASDRRSPARRCLARLGTATNSSSCRRRGIERARITPELPARLDRRSPCRRGEQLGGDAHDARPRHRAFGGSHRRPLPVPGSPRHLITKPCRTPRSEHTHLVIPEADRGCPGPATENCGLMQQTHLANEINGLGVELRGMHTLNAVC